MQAKQILHEFGVSDVSRREGYFSPPYRARLGRKGRAGIAGFDIFPDMA